MSLMKWSLKTAVAVGVVGALGLFVFGSDLVSYVKTGSNMVRSTISEAVPIEVELQRARGVVEDMIPEIHANIKLIAQEEVEIDTLEAEIERGGEALADQRSKIRRLRDGLGTEQVSFTFGRHTFSREQVQADLARRFEKVRNSEMVFAGKKRLLERRQQSLEAASRKLEEIRAAKLDLQAQIEALESQHRLVQAASAHSALNIDNSKANAARRIIVQIKKRLDVAERLLEKEQIFVDSIPVDSVVEADLLEQVDEYLAGTKGSEGLVSNTADDASF